MKSKRPPDISNLENHIGFWLRFVSNHVSQNFAQKLAVTGVTVAEWVILRKLLDTGKTTPSQLADSCGLTRGAVSKLIDRLVKKDLVSRETVGKDRRFQDINLTEKGREIVPKLAKLADENDKEFFDCLSPEDQEIFLNILKKLTLTNNLKTIPTT